ncbi:MAG: carboxymuconolactone decarboxylase family protein [Pseudomonadota bacterium]
MSENWRLAPLQPEDWPDELAPLRQEFAGRLNVYRTMAHHPKLLSAWAALRAHVVTDSALTPEQSEVVILRCGARYNVPYEWSHHILRARAIGMDDRRIASLKGDIADLAESDAMFARAVDELIADARLLPETAEALTRAHGKTAVLDLMATVGFYTTLAFVLKTFDTPLDPNVAKALLDHPLSPG